MSQDLERGELVAIGQIVKPFGVRGEMRVRPFGETPGGFQPTRAVVLESPQGRQLRTQLIRVRPEPSGYIVLCAGIATPEEAAGFRGGWIKIAEQDLPLLDPGHYYEHDLIGLAVKDEQGGLIGILEEVLSTPAHPVFVVRQHAREWLVPGTREVVTSVDVSKGEMTIRVIAGLLE